ncbi:acyl carrier protein 1, chloroplastic-like [Iris pallida]|uniref:Acyl carrier protein n=1 Tax=Iris pallida TaxID=29817 RepID=A0AAX6FKU8_IRIPA|nr:acyl carrier protein 1, chloroplastic-like [Iris pallida]
MASMTGGSISAFAPSRQIKAVHGLSGPKFVSFSGQWKSFSSVRMQPAPLRFNVSCAAKAETVVKVCEIVRKQLALSEDVAISGESKFSSLGADSLDTVEIVMGLEEEFGISVEEDNAQSISTVQDAADLIDNLVETKSA